MCPPSGRSAGQFLHADRDRLALPFLIKAVVPVVVSQIDVRGQADYFIARQSHGAHLRYRGVGAAFPLGGTAMPDGIGAFVAVQQVD